MNAPASIIAPSVLSADFARLKDELQACEAAGADWLHVDVMDGQFVPNITMGPFIVEALKRMTKLPLDCHLMIVHPEKYVEEFAKAGATWISIHPEAGDRTEEALDIIRHAGCRPALAIKPATPVETVAPFAENIEMLLIMSVNPGFSGQKLMPECLPKFARARKILGDEMLLEIDGGVNAATINDVRAAGAQAIVAATSIFKSGDYGQAVRMLRG